ncbi:MAG: pyridoxamine 5'-phosphate oxidase [Myxococcales bacterium]|nr:pyridoxamine 5'-phosphate oxidase [Myxococcales bacterium]
MSGLPDEPFSFFQAQFGAAQRSEPFDATRAALATVSGEGFPSVRFVLVKGHGPDGFTFFTNYESAKAKDLDGQGVAALGWHWHTTGCQVRASGPVARVSAEESDAYFKSRPRGSQVGAWASRQSAVVSSRDVLLRDVQEIEQRFAGRDVPRPPHWGGYRLTPVRVEFWFDGESRLHDRHLFTRQGDRWSRVRLSP